MPVKGSKWTQEDYDKFAASEKFKKAQAEFRLRASKPKTQAQKDKMSESHTGVTKTQDHKDAMSAAQKRRHELRKQILEQYPGLPVEQVWERVKEYTNDH